MADRLYLNLWFPSFEPPEIPARLLAVLKQFPFSAQRPGIAYVAVYPMSWNESPLFEETFDYSADPEHALSLLSEFLNEDYAFELEAAWELWTPAPDEYDQWREEPQAVRFLAHGRDFDDGVFQEQGHIQVDFGLDTAFLHEELDLTVIGEQRIKANVQKLVAFTAAVEKNAGVSGRVLWSESEENLAQKLIARLQQIQ